MKWRYLMIGLALSPAGAVSAQDSSCVNPATTLAERRCLSITLDQADQAMGIFVDSLKTTLGEPARAALDTASSRWLAYRHAECLAVMKSYDGGSMGLVENLNCLIALTERRQKELRALYSTGDE